MDYSNIAILAAIPFITGFIGWLTNLVAIKMLFRPKQPLNIFGVRWQGLIPRRQDDVALRTGEVIQNEILSKHLLSAELRNLDINPMIDKFAAGFIQNNLGLRLKAMPLVGGFVTPDLLAKFEVIAREELYKVVPDVLEAVGERFEEKLDIQRMVTERIAEFDLDKLEEVVNSVAKSEFRNIELLGGVLGFFVGLVQLLVLWLTGNIAI